MKIGELALAAQCTVETVRYYEAQALLPIAARSPSNYRQYGAAHLERLRFIRNCRALDMTHDEIRQLLALADAPNEGCAGVNQLVDEHIGHVQARIQELQQLAQQLQTLRQRCASEQSVDHCGILQGLAAMAPEKAERHSHLG